MLIEKREGQVFSDEKDSKAHARQARKQYQETAELVMTISRELEKK